MTSVYIPELSTESLSIEFFRQSEGNWKSQRRYYSLNSEEEPQEVVSLITVEFLQQGNVQLIKLAELHQLNPEIGLIAGTKVSWESSYTGQSRKPSKGSTIFGVMGDILYRDRGFATKDPVIATVYFPNSKTMCLKTTYGGSSFEEELKLIGDNYRTRQTIISRAGQEIMIGQYLEKRML